MLTYLPAPLQYGLLYEEFQTERYVIAFGPDTQPSCLHLTSNQQQLEKQTAYVVTNAIVMSSWWWA